MIFNINVLFLLQKYFFHSNDFSFHSIKIPNIRIIKNVIDVNVHLKILDLKILVIRGTIKIISTSKMIKIIAIKKNCIENGIRAELKKLNPHSNGTIFSRIFILFFETVIEIIIKTRVIIKQVKVEMEINII